MAKFKMYVVAAALAVSASTFTIDDACAQATSATVHASATILSAVGLQAPTAFRRNGLDDDRSLNGVAQVTSPAPHVLTAQVEAWSRTAALLEFSRVRPGRRGALPEEVRVNAATGSSPGVVRVTYTIAVIL